MGATGDLELKPGELKNAVNFLIKNLNFDF